MISELGVLTQYLLSDSLSITMPTKPLKSLKKICLNSVERVSAIHIELVESDSIEKIFSGRPFLCHYDEKV